MQLCECQGDCNLISRYNNSPDLVCKLDVTSLQEAIEIGFELEMPIRLGSKRNLRAPLDRSVVDMVYWI